MSKKENKLVKEFKEFISRGNVMDMAVGVVVGGAFTSIVNSLVNDMLMPLIGTIVGGIDLSGLVISVPNVSGGDPVTINYGNFIQNIINFLIIAFVVFLVVKGINSFKRKKEEQPAAPAPAEPSDEVKLLTEIRDALKK